jgi:RNA polymerase sigma-70 factor (ECF subfamily)
MLNSNARESEFRRQLGALLPRLSRFGMALTRSRSEADDLIQSACERALSRLEQWKPDTRLDSWMFRIMQTIWFNELRHRKVRAQHAQEVLEGESPDKGDQVAETRMFLARVEKEIQRLSEEQRIVLMLVCVEGLTYREAAEAASIPIGTVMSRLAKARLTIMERIGDSEPSRENVIKLVGKRY